MNQPKITIATAVYDDHAGVFMLVQSLRMFHDMEDVEILVLDSNPTSPNGRETEALVNSIKSHCNAVYHKHTGPGGTSQTRNELFELAKGELVVVADCHIMFQADAIKKLKAWWAATTDEEKTWLYTGSLLYDNLASVSTHFECDEFRSQMWGTWATAWMDPQGNYLVGRNYTDENSPIKHEMRMKPLMSEGPWMRSGIPWAGHEKALRAKGFKVAGEDGRPYEVPGQGLGMFISAKEHWLGFNKDFRQFGGEECQINKKYTMQGKKTINLPFMGWNHRFGRPYGTPYPLSNEGKLRNYILGFNELGMDLEPVRKHFVDESGLKQEMFDLIVADPVNFDPKNNKLYKEHPNTNLQNMQPISKSNLGMDLPLVADNLHTIALHLQNIPRDLDKHAGKLMELASQCSSIAEISHRRESTAFLLAGLTRKQACGKEECQKPKKCENTCKGPVRLMSWQSERDTLIPMLLEAVKTSPGKTVTYTDSVVTYDDALPDIQGKFDMLYLDAQTRDTLAAKLEKYKGIATKFLVIHDIHGNLANDKWLGVGIQAKAFLKANPDWFLCHFEPNNYGIIVFSCDPDLRPSEPLAPWPKTLTDGTPCGPGQQVKASLKLLGIVASPDCSCNKKAIQMDAWGPEGCRENMELILDGLKQEADARKLGHLFVRPVVRLMVSRAIRAAEKQLACGECS